MTFGRRRLGPIVEIPASDLVASNPGALAGPGTPFGGADWLRIRLDLPPTSSLAGPVGAALRGHDHALRVNLILESPFEPNDAGMLASALAPSARSLTLDIPLPADFDALQAMRHLDSASRRLLDASRAVATSGASVRWIVCGRGPIVYRLETIFQLARDSGIGMEIALPEPDSALSTDERLFLQDFVTARTLRRTAAPVTVRRLRWVDGRLTGEEEVRSASSIAPPESPEPKQDADLAAPGATATDALRVLTGGAVSHALALFARRSRSASASAGRRWRRVMLVGAYGGEHIGDAAILAGVALRLARRHGVTEAVLLSQRPEHTRRLVEMTETPVAITVEPYRRREIWRLMKEVDALVFAGGPVGDIPKQLVLHLHAAALARRRGKPFVMEGVGPGPFVRAPSRVTARRLVAIADEITVRTRESADDPLVRDRPVSVGSDPAFDYIATRPAKLTRLAAGEAERIEALLRGADGRPVIGLNTRPVYHHYAAGVGAAERGDHTRQVEATFERWLAAAIAELDRRLATKPVFVFFPMNAVHMGLSDLTSAYRISRHLDAGVDWRVWEADPSLDGVLALVRRLDVAVTMRFHATIFALSQGVETIGIDYRIGARDKVAAVLSDAGKEGDCVRIDEFESGWLVERVERSISRSPRLRPVRQGIS